MIDAADVVAFVNSRCMLEHPCVETGCKKLVIQPNTAHGIAGDLVIPLNIYSELCHPFLLVIVSQPDHKLLIQDLGTVQIYSSLVLCAD